MGRRKKEPRSVHRQNIALAASKLFMEKGIAQTSMDDIAKEAGYSKATLYVYFENKEEIVGILVLESMQKLYDYIEEALEETVTYRDKYDAICEALVHYCEEFPFYFRMALDKINVDFEEGKYLPEEKETYQVGEQINRRIGEFLQKGMEEGAFRQDIEVLPTIISLWGMLSGIIQLAFAKEEYIENAMGLKRSQFLKQSFDMLYRSIAVR